MVYIFLDWTKALRINNTHINDLVFLIFENEWFAPNPNSFGFGISGGSYGKSSLLFEKYGIEQIGFSSSIDSCNRYDGNFSLDALEKLDGIWVDFVL